MLDAPVVLDAYKWKVAYQICYKSRKLLWAHWTISSHTLFLFQLPLWPCITCCLTSVSGVCDWTVKALPWGRLLRSKSQLCPATRVTLGELWCLSFHISKMGSRGLPVRGMHRTPAEGCEGNQNCHPQTCLFDIQIILSWRQLKITKCRKKLLPLFLNSGKKFNNLIKIEFITPERALEESVYKPR